MNYHLRHLRLDGPIERLPNAYCYQVTDFGSWVASSFTHTYARVKLPNGRQWLIDGSALLLTMTCLRDSVVSLQSVDLTAEHAGIAGVLKLVGALHALSGEKRGRPCLPLREHDGPVVQLLNHQAPD